MGFDRLMEDSTKKQWMIEEGKKLLSNMMKRAEKVQQYIYCFSLFNLHNNNVFAKKGLHRLSQGLR